MKFNVDLNFNVEAESSEEALSIAKEKLYNDFDFIKENIVVKGDIIDLLILKGYVVSSLYREKVLEHLNYVGVNGDTPSGISCGSGVLINHLSKVLKELSDKELVVCINPEVRKGRIYRLTWLGEKVVDIL